MMNNPDERCLFVLNVNVVMHELLVFKLEYYVICLL